MNEPSDLRSYQLGKRAEGVLATRRRMIDAARALFLETGFHQVSVDEVAARAGVGRTTVFQHFGSKSGLLTAVESEVSARAGVDKLLRELDTDDALASLRAAFSVGCRVWAAEHEMWQKLFGLAVVDEEMKAVMADKDDKRRGLVGELVRRLQKQHRLRAGVTGKKLAELLGLLTSFQTFHALFVTSGSANKVSALLLEIVAGFVEL